jgi:hypothetical protein
MPRDLDYEKTHIGFDEQCPEGGIKCKNYELCEEVLPEWWYDCKGRYLCTNCDVAFGTWSAPSHCVYRTGKGELPFVDNKECPVCLEVKRSVTQPNCDHTMCIECFKRCHYGDKSGEPLFPYSGDIEEEYEGDQENIKWKIYFPLIDKWNREWNQWDDKRISKYDSEDHLRKCPICRK